MNVSPLDVFNLLTEAEKAQVLASLREHEPTPCERIGHKYKLFAVESSWFNPSQRKAICERCGKVVTVT